MLSKLYTQWFIKQQKISARKTIASYKMLLHNSSIRKKTKLLGLIDNERKFISYKFSDTEKIQDLIEIIHKFRHFGLTKNSNYADCIKCKKILSEISIEPDLAQDNFEPKFGNLIDILEKEVSVEREIIEKKRLPSQNDLTRWALKDAVLAYYQGLNITDNISVVDTLHDNRLITKLAPDFSIIAKIWLEKHDVLKRRDDKYMLEIEEYDKAEADLIDGMRGSAFEKQLDRYREKFVERLKQI